MPNPDQIDFKQSRRGKGVWTIELDFNRDFVEYIKSKVPSSSREYDGELRVWTIYDPTNFYLPTLESVAVQKFRYATKSFYNAEGQLVIKNLHTGGESIIK